MPYLFQEAYDRLHDTSSSATNKILAKPALKNSIRLAIHEEHERSVIETYNILKSQSLSHTIKSSQEHKIDGKIWEQVDQEQIYRSAERDSALARRSAMTMHRRTVRRTKRYRTAVAEQQTFAMETIPEDSTEDGESMQQLRRPTDIDMKRSQTVATRISQYTQLMASDDIPADLRKHIDVVLAQFRLYQFANDGRDRPQFEDLLMYDRALLEMESDMQIQLQFQVNQLREFLGSLLFGEYVSMNPDHSDRNKCWKLSGKYLLWQDEAGQAKETAMEQLGGQNHRWPRRSQPEQPVATRVSDCFQVQGPAAHPAHRSELFQDTFQPGSIRAE